LVTVYATRGAFINACALGPVGCRGSIGAWGRLGRSAPTRQSTDILTCQQTFVDKVHTSIRRDEFVKVQLFVIIALVAALVTLGLEGCVARPGRHKQAHLVRGCLCDRDARPLFLQLLL
jgi:hypothetical protein